MWVYVGFTIAALVLVATVVRRRFGYVTANDDVWLGASGFWVVMLGGGILLTKIF